MQRVSNPSDRRQNLIKVTPYSKKIRDKVEALAYESAREILDGISREELEIFLKALATMEKNMDSSSDLKALAEKYPTNKKDNNV